MKKRLICFLLMGAVVLGLCSCQNQQKEEVAQVDLLEENSEQNAQVPQQPASLPVFDEENDPQAVEYLKMQYQVQESEDIDSIVQRMWYLGNFIYFADEETFAESVPQKGMQNAPEHSRYVDFENLTAHLYTEKGKEQLLSAMVGGGKYIEQQDGEYYHLGAWRTEPPYHLWMSGYQTVKSSEGQIKVQVDYQEKDLQNNVTSEGSVMMTLVNHDGIWLIDDYQSPTACYPSEVEFDLPVNPEHHDQKVVEYLKMQYQPQEEEDVDSIVERMWYLGNYIYLAGEITFCVPVPQEEAPREVYSCCFVDFEELTDHLYTENGKEQLLRAIVGGGNYIQEKDGKYYHLGDWRTEPAHYSWMSGYQTLDSKEDWLKVEVTYDEQDFQGNILGKKSVPMTLVRQNGIWLIEDYISPTDQYFLTKQLEEGTFRQPE